MTELIGTDAAAKALAVTRRTVQRLCKTHDVGTVVGRDRVLSPEDFDRLRAIARTGRGNPEMSTEAGQARLQRRAKRARKTKSRS